jgi:hypothetical protein
MRIAAMILSPAISTSRIPRPLDPGWVDKTDWDSPRRPSGDVEAGVLPHDAARPAVHRDGKTVWATMNLTSASPLTSRNFPWTALLLQVTGNPSEDCRQIVLRGPATDTNTPPDRARSGAVKPSAVRPHRFRPLRLGGQLWVPASCAARHPELVCHLDGDELDV